MKLTICELSDLNELITSCVNTITCMSLFKNQVTNEELFFKVIKCAFMQKRKTLVNSLSNSGISSKETLENILNELGIDTRIRAEQLSLEQFGYLSDKLDK